MSHHNFFLDYTVGVFVVRNGKCLLCHHRNMDLWLPVGGHIDENELPDQAAVRETKEETGLDVKLIGLSCGIKEEKVQSCVSPLFVDRHFVRGEHWHCSFSFAAIPTDDNQKIVIDWSEHKGLDWFSPEEIDKITPTLPTIRYYSKYIINLLSIKQMTGKAHIEI